MAAINAAIEGLPDDVHVSMHICQGNYPVGREYDAQIGHRYFHVGDYKTAEIRQIDCSSFLIEYDMAYHYEGLLGDRQPGVGAADVRDPKASPTHRPPIRPGCKRCGRAADFASRRTCLSRWPAYK